MALADILTTASHAVSGDRPRDDELDLFGLTHRGKVRADNQDHFLLATVHPQVVVHGTSLPQPDALPLRGEWLATVLLVADGVGGGNGQPRQITRDQTVAQDLVDMGVLPADRARRSPYHDVLARAIGGEEATPEVSRLNLIRGGVVLLCSDGLTKHVTDAEIEERLGRLRSSEQVARELLDLAWSAGERITSPSWWAA